MGDVFRSVYDALLSMYDALLPKWPDFVVTFLGVLLGALFALWIQRRGVRQQRGAERRRDLEHLLAHMDRVKLELRDNAAWVKRLQGVLAKSPNARVDLFRFATQLASALSVSAYEDLTRSGLQRFLEEDVQSDLFDARQRVIGLKTMLEAGQPALEFFLGYSADQASADLHLDNAKTYSQTTLEGLEEAKRLAYEAAAALREKLKKR